MKKARINPENQDDKCFQYAPTIALNFEEIASHPEIVSNIIPFTYKYNWERVNHPSKIDDWKSLRKIIQQLFLIFCITMKKKYFQLILQNITQPVKKEIILLTITNEEEEG